MREWLAGGGSVILTLVTLLLTGGTLVGLIKVWPERKQIDAQTVTEGATAASLLTAQAMVMVKEAREAATVRINEMQETVTAAKAEAAEQRARATSEHMMRRLAEDRASACQAEVEALLRSFGKEHTGSTGTGHPAPPEKE